MGTIVLSYDLHGVESDKGAYERLHEQLKIREFFRAPVESTWKKEYVPLSRLQAAKQAERQFKEAAEKAKILNYDVVIYSSEEMIEIDVNKVRPKGT